MTDDPADPLFEPNPKQVAERVGRVGAAPADGQAALERSVQVKATSTRRVGVDATNGEIVVLDEHRPGRFYGHVRTWDQLTPAMRQALIEADLVDRRGRIRPQ